MEIKVKTDILSRNAGAAAENRQLFNEHKLLVMNIMGSPGAGKTTVLEKTIDALADKVKLAVIEGDIYTSQDAQRIEKRGVPVKQINTGGACHLDAAAIERTLGHFTLQGIELLIIENVGNLVCPVEFDLGEDLKVAVLSIAEGDDKPLKYPLLFREAGAVVLNKMDLLEFTDVNMDRLRKDLKKINPHINIFEVSARTNQGIAEWALWLTNKIQEKKLGGKIL